MPTKYLLLFRMVLLEVLLFQILFAPGWETQRGGVWAAFLPYVVWTAAWHFAAWFGKIPRQWHLWSFLIDIAMTSAVLSLTNGTSSDLYIAYFLVILASCFLDDLRMSFLVGGVACVVYAALAFPGREAAFESHYLLRISLLLVISFFSAYVVDQSRHLQDAASQALASMQRLSLVGQAITNVLHETKTPLNTIVITAEHLKGAAGQDAEAKEQLELICSEAERASSVLESYLEFTRPTQLRLEPLSLAAPIRSTLDALRLRFKESGVAVETFPDPDARVLGSERHLVQAFTNIAVNSLNAMPFGGKFSVSQRTAGGKTELSFKDTGVGIPPEKLSRLFHPFADSSEEGPGHGLGLSITLWILQKHSGGIEIRSDGLRRGTEVLVTLPTLKS